MSILFEVRDVANVKRERHFVFFRALHHLHMNLRKSWDPTIEPSTCHPVLARMGGGCLDWHAVSVKSREAKKIPVWQASPRLDGPFCLKPNQPPAFPLWVLCRPLPVSGKLPAWSLFHQKLQEMSLTVRWSLIKNKWMGCSQGLYEWREGSWHRYPAVKGELRGKTKRVKQSIKMWSHYPVFLYSDESEKPKPAAMRGSREQAWQRRSASGSFKTI